MAEWKTTKIKADTLQEAKELNNTYTELMQIGIDAVKYRADSDKWDTSEFGVGEAENMYELVTLLADDIGELSEDRNGRKEVDELNLANGVVEHINMPYIGHKVGEELRKRGGI